VVYNLIFTAQGRCRRNHKPNTTKYDVSGLVSVGSSFAKSVRVTGYIAALVNASALVVVRKHDQAVTAFPFDLFDARNVFGFVFLDLDRRGHRCTGHSNSNQLESLEHFKLYLVPASLFRAFCVHPKTYALQWVHEVLSPLPSIQRLDVLDVQPTFEGRFSEKQVRYSGLPCRVPSATFTDAAVSV
jgi:hypothetical protein